MDNEDYKNFYSYRIYCDGRIFSKRKNAFLKPDVSKVGYEQVRLFDDNKVSKRYKVHRIVAMMFCNPPENFNFMSVNHIDGNKHNNDYRNLEWCTVYENNKHARDLGLNNIAKSNSDRWKNAEFRRRTSENMSKGRKAKGSSKGRRNPMFRYDIHDKNGKLYFISDVSQMLNLSYSQTYKLITEHLKGIRDDDRLLKLQLTIKDIKEKVNRPSKETGDVS